MYILDNVTSQFVSQSRKILKDNLVGIYLHGSAVMGCFHEKKSDIDLLVVVNNGILDEIKRQCMDMVVELNSYAPQKGIEVSYVRRDVCRPFRYPTPFELHFSVMHLKWYQTNPEGYIADMHGFDKDLAAHFMITYHRGKCLFGANIRDVFEEPDREFYLDSIWSDVENAEEEIMTNPVYIILNLCRVLAYKQEGLILSKQEGGEWGIEHIPPKYYSVLLYALQAYISGESMQDVHTCKAIPEKHTTAIYKEAWEDACAREYAAYMIGRIKNEALHI